MQHGVAEQGPGPPWAPASPPRLKSLSTLSPPGPTEAGADAAFPLARVLGSEVFSLNTWRKLSLNVLFYAVFYMLREMQIRFPFSLFSWHGFLFAFFPLDFLQAPEISDHFWENPAVSSSNIHPLLSPLKHLLEGH